MIDICIPIAHDIMRPKQRTCLRWVHMAGVLRKERKAGDYHKTMPQTAGETGGTGGSGGNYWGQACLGSCWGDWGNA